MRAVRDPLRWRNASTEVRTVDARLLFRVAAAHSPFFKGTGNSLKNVIYYKKLKIIVRLSFKARRATDIVALPLFTLKKTTSGSWGDSAQVILPAAGLIHMCISAWWK